MQDAVTIDLYVPAGNALLYPYSAFDSALNQTEPGMVKLNSDVSLYVVLFVVYTDIPASVTLLTLTLPVHVTLSASEGEDENELGVVITAL